MANQRIGVTDQPAAAGVVEVDATEISDGANNVQRQRVILADDATFAALAKIANAAPGASDYGLVVRHAGALPAGTNNIGDVDVLTLPALAAGTARIGAVRPVDSADADLTSAKGTQTARLLGTQDAKDAGRQQVLLFWDYVNAVAGTTALANFTTGTRNAAALGAANNLQVSAGKTLRIQAVIVTVAATSTTRPALRCQIRQAATVANTSPIIWESKRAIEAIGTLAADIPSHTDSTPIPDGLEVAAGQQITFTILAPAAHGKAAMTIIGYEY